MITIEKQVLSITPVGAEVIFYILKDGKKIGRRVVQLTTEEFESITSLIQPICEEVTKRVHVIQTE